jgi:hypothetical protein
MAAALVVAAASRTNMPLAVTGTEFQVSSPVVISIPQENIEVTVTSDENGDFDLSAIFDWKPRNTGRLTINADDGTDSLSADIMIYSTT